MLFRSKRADIVIINYWHRIKNIEAIKQRFLTINNRLKVYLADYKFMGFKDKNNNLREVSYFAGKPVAALTGIGYPGGFLNIIKGLNIGLAQEFIFPDHYELRGRELCRIEKYLKIKGIGDIIITNKDFYHLDLSRAKLNYFILKVALKIEDEADFLRDIKNRLNKSR